MVRFLVVFCLALAAASCDTLAGFKDYKVRIDDPTRKDEVVQQPYYDYQRKETMYQR